MLNLAHEFLALYCEISFEFNRNLIRFNRMHYSTLIIWAKGFTEIRVFSNNELKSVFKLGKVSHELNLNDERYFEHDINIIVQLTM